jgi:hypothetical protein
MENRFYLQVYGCRLTAIRAFIRSPIIADDAYLKEKFMVK